MDYKQGLTTLKKLAASTDWYTDLLLYEARLLENLQQEQLYGPTEQTRATRAQIIHQLNHLAYQYLNASFTDLCLQPPTPSPHKDNASPLSAPPTRRDSGLSLSVDRHEETSIDPISQLSPIDIFIGYNHKDTKHLNELRTHLTPYIRSESINVWDTTMISPGANWREELIHALQTAKIAILLISPDFLASDFIVTKELPSLLQSAEQNGLKILPIILRPCAFLDPAIAQYQAINDPTRPLSLMRPSERDQVWGRVVMSVKEILQD